MGTPLKAGPLGVRYMDHGDFIVIVQSIYLDPKTGKRSARPSFIDRVGEASENITEFHAFQRFEKAVARNIDGLLEKGKK